MMENKSKFVKKPTGYLNREQRISPLVIKVIAIRQTDMTQQHFSTKTELHFHKKWLTDLLIKSINYSFQSLTLS